MNTHETITRRMTENLSVQHLEVRDDSHKHAGHNEAAKSGGTHFSVLIVSTDFEGMTRIARHQKVYALFKDIMPTPLHALALKTLTPDEFQNLQK
jgi:BolA protein